MQGQANKAQALPAVSSLCSLSLNVAAHGLEGALTTPFSTQPLRSTAPPQTSGVRKEGYSISLKCLHEACTQRPDQKPSVLAPTGSLNIRACPLPLKGNCCSRSGLGSAPLAFVTGRIAQPVEGCVRLVRDSEEHCPVHGISQ